MVSAMHGALLAAFLMTAAVPSHAAELRAPELRAIVPPDARPETVFDWRTQACEGWDVPDAPARAWRSADGTVHLLAAHTTARALTGPTLDRVAPDCRVVFDSGRQDDPARYDDRGWLAAPYTTDGRTVYALVHNEFHGHERRALCPAGDYAACWWNSVTLAVSEDGGRRFRGAGYVAGIPYRFRGDLGRRAGLFGPSNIIAQDGWYYATAFAEETGAQKRGVCLMRTHELSAPDSWRGWDGRDFTVRFLDPYAASASSEPPAGHVCQPMPAGRLPFTVTGLVRHAPSGLTLAVMAGRRAERPGAEPVSGVWVSSSADLRSWSVPRLAWAAPLMTDRDRCGTAETLYYPSILDPDSLSRNFEDTDGDAFLYLTRLRMSGCKPTRERDLVRVPIHIDAVADR
ncbi:hypothetical protein SAMN02982994_0176 [Azospirillum lipoferum]|nr:hypothetical protein SAMN02982994_0176 [Azospirillum lipoferum]